MNDLIKLLRDNPGYSLSVTCEPGDVLGICLLAPFEGADLQRRMVYRDIACPTPKSELNVIVLVAEKLFKELKNATPK